MPDWNRGQIRTEFLSRGFWYLEADGITRINDMIQRAVEELTQEELWPWRSRHLSITVGDQPGDLGNIEQIRYQGRPLIPITSTELHDLYGDSVGTIGTPRYYYWEHDQINTHPGTDAELAMRYFSNSNWIRNPGEENEAETRNPSNDSNVPICPQEWRDLIVELCCTYGQADSEDYDERNSNRDQYEARLDEMKRALMSRVNDEPRKIRMKSGEDWA